MTRTRLWMLAGTLLAGLVPAAHAQDTIGGHIGFFLPLVTHSAGQTTNLTDNFTIGIPIGLTVRGRGPLSFDLELVPTVQDTPRNVSLVVQPGLLWDVGHRVDVGMRGAFDVNTPAWGFTPLVRKSWPIQRGDKFFKTYFVEADLPIRFDRPTGGPSTNALTFGVHFGVGF